MSGPWLRFIPAPIRKTLEGRSHVQLILGNVSWLSADRLVRMGVGLIVGVWVARYLGPEQYGTLNFAAAFVSLFSPLALLGLDSIVIREVVRTPGESGRTLGTAFGLKLVGGLAAGLAAIIVIVLSRPGEGLLHALVVIAAAGWVFQSVDTIDFWFQSKVRAKYVVYARNVAFLLVAAVKLVMILLQLPLIAFAWAALLELACAAAGLLLFYVRDGQSVRLWRISVARARALLHDSWPLFLSGISIALYMRIDQVMIGYMLNDEAVGTYVVATRLIEVWYFLPMAIAASVLPSLISARKADVNVYRERLQEFYDIIGIVVLGIAVPTSLLSTPIVSFLYGQQFIAAGPILAIYAWGSVPVFLGVASNQHFVVENRTRIILYRTFGGLIASVVLNIVLIHAYGAIGAAMAFLASNLVVAFSIASMPGAEGQVAMLLRALFPLRLLKRFRS